MSSGWAKEMLRSNAVILDTETTGLGSRDEVIQIGVIDMQGQTIFDALLRPTCPISVGAAAVHKINTAALIDAPTWRQIEDNLFQILKLRPVLIYNADFDKRMLKQTAAAHETPSSWLDALDYYCVMKRYANGGKWAKLTGGDHTALGDCRATLELLKRMASDA